MSIRNQSLCGVEGFLDSIDCSTIIKNFCLKVLQNSLVLLSFQFQFVANATLLCLKYSMFRNVAI